MSGWSYTTTGSASSSPSTQMRDAERLGTGGGFVTYKKEMSVMVDFENIVVGHFELRHRALSPRRGRRIGKAEGKGTRAQSWSRQESHEPDWMMLSLSARGGGPFTSIQHTGQSTVQYHSTCVYTLLMPDKDGGKQVAINPPSLWQQSWDGCLCSVRMVGQPWSSQ